MKIRTALPAAAFALLTGAVIAAPAVAQPTDPAPPSLVQLCAATGVEEIDDLLADVARSELVDELSPLLTLLVPESESVELDASVQLEDVRDRLNCAPVDEDDEPSTDPTPTPTPTPAPVDEDPAPGNDDQDDDDQDDDVQNGLPDRAPRPTVVDADLTVTG